ncbi:MAG: polyprenyl synthetase family protein [Leptolyngbya sp. PLA1]|nr:polyprenyl synthetase family protein [Leptolyngbya sp. PLA1]
MHALFDIPADLAPLAAFLAERLQVVSRRFDDELASDLPPVAALCRHIERYKGKMLRPSLVLLSGLAAHPRAADLPPQAILGDEHTDVAAVCEMVHMATLVHDDVLDEAEVRRRGATINHLQGNEPAVILGDYLFASAYHLCARLQSPEPARAIARASAALCAGELLQLHHRNNHSLDEPTYDRIITLKTAELVAVAAELGAHVAGAAPASQAALARYARLVGEAFQIQDDILDLLGSVDVVGKSTGKDLEKGKLTLPLIHHLAHAEPLAALRTLEILRSIPGGDFRPGTDSTRILEAVEATGSVEYARSRARTRVADAKACLSALPASPARTLLAAMADAVVDRAY